MISFDYIAKVFSRDLEGEYCIEIEFSVEGYPEYQSCWMGKLPDKSDREKEIYWFGLVADGSEAYDFENFGDFSKTAVFSGKSLSEIWDKVVILSIDGCNPENRLKAYL